MGLWGGLVGGSPGFLDLGVLWVEPFILLHFCIEIVENILKVIDQACVLSNELILRWLKLIGFIKKVWDEFFIWLIQIIYALSG